MKDLMSKIAALSMNRVAIAGVAITAAYFFLLYDSGSTIETEMQTIKTQIETETAKKVETEKILKKEEQMRADVQLLAKTYDEVKSRIPLEFESSELRTIVEQISNNTDLKIIKLKSLETRPSSDPSPDANLVEQVSIEYTFQGNYAQILNFINQSASLEKIIKTTNIKLNVGNDSDGGPVRQLTLDAVVLGYKQAATKAPAKEPVK